MIAFGDIFEVKIGSPTVVRNIRNCFIFSQDGNTFQLDIPDNCAYQENQFFVAICKRKSQDTYVLSPLFIYKNNTTDKATPIPYHDPQMPYFPTPSEDVQKERWKDLIRYGEEVKKIPARDDIYSVQPKKEDDIWRMGIKVRKFHHAFDGDSKMLPCSYIDHQNLYKLGENYLFYKDNIDEVTLPLKYNANLRLNNGKDVSTSIYLAGFTGERKLHHGTICHFYKDGMFDQKIKEDISEAIPKITGRGYVDTKHFCQENKLTCQYDCDLEKFKEEHRSIKHFTNAYQKIFLSIFEKLTIPGNASKALLIGEEPPHIGEEQLLEDGQECRISVWVPAKGIVDSLAETNHLLFAVFKGIVLQDDDHADRYNICVSMLTAYPKTANTIGVIPQPQNGKQRYQLGEFHNVCRQ